MTAGFIDTVVKWESKGIPNEKNKPPIRQIIVFLQNLDG